MMQSCQREPESWITIIDQSKNEALPRKSAPNTMLGECKCMFFSLCNVISRTANMDGNRNDDLGVAILNNVLSFPIFRIQNTQTSIYNQWFNKKTFGKRGNASGTVILLYVYLASNHIFILKWT